MTRLATQSPRRRSQRSRHSKVAAVRTVSRAWCRRLGRATPGFNNPFRRLTSSGSCAATASSSTDRWQCSCWASKQKMPSPGFRERRQRSTRLPALLPCSCDSASPTPRRRPLRPCVAGLDSNIEHQFPAKGGADEGCNKVRDSCTGAILPESTKRLPVLPGG
jgi:hypothetical protein